MLRNSVGITGCSGMLGSHLVKFFLKKKYNVIGTSRTKLNLKNKKFKWIKLDLSSLNKSSDFNNVFDNVETIIHAGAIVPSKNFKPNRNDYLSTNINASKKLIFFAKKKKIHLIYISGAIVYERNDKKSLENFKIKKKNNTLNYENSKKIIDMFLSGKKKNKNLKFTILRATSIYGHRLSKDKIIKKLLLNCQKRKKIFLKEPFERINFIHACDVANASYLSVIKKKYGVFNIGSDELYSIKEIAEICNKIFKKKSQLHIKKDNKDLVFKTRFNISNKKAKKILKWEPKISMKKGLKLVYNNEYI